MKLNIDKIYDETQNALRTFIAKEMARSKCNVVEVIDLRNATEQRYTKGNGVWSSDAKMVDALASIIIASGFFVDVTMKRLGMKGYRVNFKKML